MRYQYNKRSGLILPVRRGLILPGPHRHPAHGVIASAAMMNQQDAVTAVGGGNIPAGTSGSVDVNLPFTPGVGFLWMMGPTQTDDSPSLSTTTHIRASFGMFNGAAEQYAWGAYAEDAAATTNTAMVSRADSGLIFVHSASYREVQVTVSAGKFTLTIGSNGGGTWPACRFQYFVISDAIITNSKVTVVFPTAGTGSQSLTHLGWQPDGLVFASMNQATNAIFAGLAMSLGAAQGSAAQWSYNMQSRDNEAGVSEDNSYLRVADECIGTIGASNGVPDRRIRFTSRDATGFTINRLEHATTFGMYHTAIKGPQIAVGSFSSNPAGGTITVGFPPKGAMFFTHAKVANSADAASADAILCIGAIDENLNERCMLGRVIDNQGTSTLEIAVRDDSIALRTESGAITSRVHATGFTATGITYSMPVTTHSGREIGYVIVG